MVETYHIPYRVRNEDRISLLKANMLQYIHSCALKAETFNIHGIKLPIYLANKVPLSFSLRDKAAELILFEPSNKKSREILKGLEEVVKDMFK